MMGLNVSNFEGDADRIERLLREEGFLSADIVSVAYVLLNRHIDTVEKMISNEANLASLLARAEALLDDDE